MTAANNRKSDPVKRIRIWYVLILLVSAVFIVRLFYMQILQHSYYKQAALTGQLKEYAIPAERGVILAQSGDGAIPIVLNEIKYTLYADPVYVTSSKKAARKLANITGAKAKNYEKKLRLKDTRYVILTKKLDQKTSQAINKLELKGIGTRGVPQRSYPQGKLAAQVLGFVNDEGQGTYGLEQALNNELSGTPGQLKAITDAEGVPLAANKDNVIIDPAPGNRVETTIDIGMQQQLEDILKQGVAHAISESGSAVIIEADTGAVKAMAGYPTYDPAEFYRVKDASVFTNPVVGSPLEIGSIMKPLTMAAALDLGVVNESTSYADPGAWVVDGETILNVVGERGSGTRTMGDILQRSLNTGATWLLMQMGGGEINSKARNTWHQYMSQKYGFGRQTGIEQGYEASGTIPKPDDGFGLNIQFANSAFGQGMTATTLQVGAALAGVVNGGNYYQPRLIEKTTDSEGREESFKPKKLGRTVSASAAESLRNLMEYAFSENHQYYGMDNLRSEYSIGGKTGTAQIPNPEGGYYENSFNGTFMGFVGGDSAEYVIVTRVNDPKIAGYAGTTAAGPIFVELAEMLINNFGVRPKSE